MYPMYGKEKELWLLFPFPKFSRRKSALVFRYHWLIYHLSIHLRRIIFSWS